MTRLEWLRRARPTTTSAEQGVALTDRVVRRAEGLGTAIERRLAHVRWRYWQLPPGLRRKGRLARVVERLGDDGAALLVLSGRWRLLAGALAYSGALILGARAVWSYVAGAFLEFLALLCVCAMVRRERSSGVHELARPRFTIRRITGAHFGRS